MAVVSRRHQHGGLNLQVSSKPCASLWGARLSRKEIRKHDTVSVLRVPDNFQLMSFRKNFIPLENCFMSINSKACLSSRWKYPANSVLQKDIIGKVTWFGGWTGSLAVTALLSSNPLTSPWPVSILYFIILSVLGHIPSRENFPEGFPLCSPVHTGIHLCQEWTC